MEPKERFRIAGQMKTFKQIVDEREAEKRKDKRMAAIVIGGLFLIVLAVLLLVPGCSRPEVAQSPESEKWAVEESLNTGCWDVQISTRGQGVWVFRILSHLAKPIQVQVICVADLVDMDGKRWGPIVGTVVTMPEQEAEVVLSLPENHGSFSYQIIPAFSQSEETISL